MKSSEFCIDLTFGIKMKIRMRIHGKVTAILHSEFQIAPKENGRGKPLPYGENKFRILNSEF